MFSSMLSRVFLVFFVVVILAIPLGAYYLSVKQEEAVSTPVPSPTPTKTITQAPSPKAASFTPTSPTPTPSSTAPQFGPTMDFKVALEGRPPTYQVAKLFLGVAAGAKAVKPTYLLIYSVDLPGDGAYSGLSLAGLTAGTQYTAYLKGPAQIDTAVTFTMASTVTSLNGGTTVKLLTGDLNEDNVVNSADFSIVSSAFGAGDNSPNWNALADFNRDGVINSLDIGFIIKNFGKTGDSGPVTSTPGTASSSAQLKTTPTVGGPDEATSSVKPLNPPTNQRGYWLWVPEL